MPLYQVTQNELPQVWHKAAPLLQKAIDLEFDGLMIESHIDPDNAWSDAKQQITPEVLAEMLDSIIWRKEDVPSEQQIDYLFVPIGGGGLSAGVGTYFKQQSPNTKIIGLEPEGAPSMKAALEAGHPVELESIDKFVDGAAVKRIGDITFEYCKRALDDMHLVPEGKICTTILEMYNKEAIVVEPAGTVKCSPVIGL